MSNEKTPPQANASTSEALPKLLPCQYHQSYVARCHMCNIANDTARVAIDRLEHYCTPYGNHHADTLRAHIAAQAEKIAHLRESAKQLQSENIAQRDKNAALEASNKRLRDAADIALGHMTGGLDGNYADCDPVEKLRTALAQAEEVK